MAKPSQSRYKIVLLVILVLALFVRVVGLVPGHNYYHPDEPMSYGSTTDMFVYGDLNPRRFDYPAGVPLLHYGVYKSYILPFIYVRTMVLHPRVFFAALERGQRFFEEFRVSLFGPRDLNALYWSRSITAVLGVLNVLVVYAIGSNLIHSYAGLVAASLVAVNYRHVLSSHLALSDIPNAFFATLSFYATLLLFQKNSWRRYLWAALAVALSINMKYQTFALVPFLSVHVIWAVRKRRFSLLFNKHVLVSLLIIIGILLLSNPYLPFNWEKTKDIIRVVYLRYGAGANRFNIYPLYYLYYWGIGKAASIAILIGFFVSVIRYPRQSFLILTYVAPFLYAFLYYMTGGTYVRNFTTIIPFVSLFAGMGLYTGYRAIAKYLKPTFSRAVIAAIAIAINIFPLKDSLALSLSYSTPWVRDRLTQWAYANLPDNATVLNDNTSIPSDPQKPLTLIPWSRDEANSVTKMMKQNIDFAVLNLNWNQAYFYWFDLPLQKLTAFDGIPYPILKNTYHGLLLSEYKLYGVFAAYRPWQAPDDTYLVMKIPIEPKSVGTIIWSSDFEKNLEGWRGTEDVVWNNLVGFGEPGSLELTGQNQSRSLTRVISQFLPVISGYTYTIEGYIKTDEVRNSNQKDGFFRVDFYENQDPNNVTKSGVVTAVSESVYGESQWRKMEIVVSAPSKARYMTVSVQRSQPGVSGHYWIDDVKLFESQEQLGERFPEIPYVGVTIADDLVYPNSIY